MQRFAGDDPTDELRVVIADDHPFYRNGLAEVLRDAGMDVVADVPNGDEAIRAVEELVPDVVVMDLNMPGISGIEATRRLSEVAPATRVLVLTVSAQEADVTDAILAGACGYVLKEGPIDEVVTGIRAAAVGQSFISPRIATLLLRRLHDEDRARSGASEAHLSSREIEVLVLMSAGKANHEIAEALVISNGTVRHHIANILIKLQVDNRVQAAVRAVRGRIV